VTERTVIAGRHNVFTPSIEDTDMTVESLYDRLGGREGIRTVVDTFYDRLDSDPEIGPFFDGADMEKLRRIQTDFLCEAAGGPETYDADPVRTAHLDIPFEPRHIQRAIEHLEQSLDNHEVPNEDAELVVSAIADFEDDLLARENR
jgi:hemoglobin